MLNPSSIHTDYHVRDSCASALVMDIQNKIERMQTLAKRLKEARAKTGFSQAKLAKLAGVSQSTIANIESGTRFEPQKVVQIARALGVSAEWLLEGRESRAAPQPIPEPDNMGEVCADFFWTYSNCNETGQSFLRNAIKTAQQHFIEADRRHLSIPVERDRRHK